MDDAIVLCSKKRDLALSRLVDTALKHTSVQRTYDIAFNLATGALRSVGAEALPEIESVLIEKSNACQDVNSLPGLSEVLVVYCDLANEFGIERACGLLRSLRGSFQVEALTAIWSIWIGRATRDLIPSQLLEEIKLIAARGSSESGEKAIALLKSYSALRPR
jgi:hypothetical protein